MKYIEEYVMICPQCASTDVVSDFSQPGLVAGGIFPHKCNHCGYIARMFPEVPKKDVPKK